MKKNWGIIGLGSIAHKFVSDLSLVKDAILYAVASRNLSKAEMFAAQHDAVKAYGSYHSLFSDTNVDIIYIATPHNTHAELTIAAMIRGKHVLCEKPLAVNAKDVLQMIRVAREQNVYLMEALWSRFNPAISAVKTKIDSGIIGTIKEIKADFSFKRNDSETSRLLNMDLAGGSLLDMGIYPVFLSYFLLGKPRSISAAAQFHKTGADIETRMELQYDDATAHLLSGFLYDSDMVARIYGTEGTIHIHKIWHEAQAYSVIKNEKEEHIKLPTKGIGYTHEIISCHEHLNLGKTENDLWSLQNSLDLITILDEVRAKINLTYPFE